MTLASEFRKTIELRNSLTNIQFEKSDIIRQRDAIRNIRTQTRETARLTKEFYRFTKKGGQIADAIEKGKWNKAFNNDLLGGKMNGILNAAGFALGIAGVGLGLANLELSRIKSEAQQAQIEIYGRELGNQLKILLRNKKRIERIEKQQQRNSADLDILSGALGKQTIKINKLETGQTFLQTQYTQIQEAFNTATNIFNSGLQATRTELINRINAIRNEVRNPRPTQNFDINVALSRARQALDTALLTAKKQTDQEQRIKALERQRTQGFENQLRIALSRANQAINAANEVKNNFENQVKGQIEQIKADIAKERELQKERDKFINRLKELGTEGIIREISQASRSFYDRYLKPSVLEDLRGTQIKADTSLQISTNNARGLNKQQQEIAEIKRQLTITEFNSTKRFIEFQRELDTNNNNVNKQQDKKLDDMLRILGDLSTGTALLQSQQNRVRTDLGRLRQDMPTLAAEGTCRTLRPGGCSANALQGLGNQVNQNTNQLGNRLDAANSAANAAQLGLLRRIDTKLGLQLPGGLTGGIKRIFDNAIVDRAINTYALILSFHNAAMLSNSLFESILGAGDLILQAMGFKIKDAEGNQIDLNQAVRTLWQGFLTSLFGAETVRQINENWARWNRIYQSAANLLSLTQSMFDSLRSVLEVSAQYTGKIGNALKSAGVVFDDAYDWMSEKLSNARGRLAAFQRFSEGLESAENITSNVASVAGSVVSIQQETNEFKQEQQNFNNLLNNQTTEKTNQESQSTQASQSPTITITQERNPNN